MTNERYDPADLENQLKAAGLSDPCIDAGQVAGHLQVAADMAALMRGGPCPTTEDSDSA